MLFFCQVLPIHQLPFVQNADAQSTNQNEDVITEILIDHLYGWPGERSVLRNIQPPPEEGARNWKYVKEHTLHQIYCIRVHSPLRPKHCSLRWENWSYNPAFSRIWAPWRQEFLSAGICALSKVRFCCLKDRHPSPTSFCGQNGINIQKQALNTPTSLPFWAEC